MPLISLGFELPDFLRQGRHNREQVPDDTVVCQLEDRSIRVFVNGNDILRRRHSSKVLNGSTDAARNVQRRRYGLACLTYLVLVFNPPGIHRRPGGPNRAAQGIGKILDNSEILRTFKPPSPETMMLASVSSSFWPPAAWIAVTRALTCAEESPGV